MPSADRRVPAGVKVLSVSELTTQVRTLLEDAFQLVWVAGEVSNYRPHSSGHVYLTLKDGQSQLKAVIWRSQAAHIPFTLSDGLEVIARGHLGVYAVRGEYQLYVEELLPKGIGALELAFRQLKEKLQARGWFDPARKKPLPRFPRCVALVTSPTGAAVRDMLRIIPRRWPVADVLIVPVAVQGDDAARQIAEAIRLLNRLSCADVLIVGRGGGSLEDLWAFNEEVVAAAIVESAIPVVSAVGHEIDVTIADFVADCRAATPSEAAELVVPDQQELRQHLETHRRRLTGGLLDRLASVRRRLDELSRRRVFRQPRQRLEEWTQRLDEWQDRLRRAVRHRLDRARERVVGLAARLEALSPLSVLGRGYSLTRTADGTLLRSAAQVAAGDRIVTRLARGEVTSRVEQVHPSREPSPVTNGAGLPSQPGRQDQPVQEGPPHAGDAGTGRDL
jgi:exodeoxyribonuclease VII large subunit